MLSIGACCEQDGTPKGGHRPTSSRREALGGPSPLETGNMRNFQASLPTGPGLCARADWQPLPVSSKAFVRPSSPSSPALHGGFVKGTIQHSEETTQLPPEPPREQNRPSVCQRPPPLPGPLPPSSGLPRGNSEAIKPPLCGNPGDAVLSCPQRYAAATLWQWSSSRLLMATQTGLPGKRAFTGNFLLMDSNKAIETDSS